MTKQLSKDGMEGNETNIKTWGIGRYCIIRSEYAGVHAGIVISRQGNEALIKDARRLWYWKTPKSISLSAVALDGIVHEASTIPETIPEHLVIGVVEVIPTTKLAEDTIRTAPIAQQE